MMGRGASMSMFAANGKLKKDVGVVAVHAVVELIDLGWKPRGVR